MLLVAKHELTHQLADRMIKEIFNIFNISKDTRTSQLTTCNNEIHNTRYLRIKATPLI